MNYMVLFDIINPSYTFRIIVHEIWEKSWSSMEEKLQSDPMRSSLPRSFEKFKYSLIYDKKYVITFDEVVVEVISKELSKHKYLKNNDSGDCLSL